MLFFWNFNDIKEFLYLYDMLQKKKNTCIITFMDSYKNGFDRSVVLLGKTF